jgi:hypothetical protein
MVLCGGRQRANGHLVVGLHKDTFRSRDSHYSSRQRAGADARQFRQHGWVDEREEFQYDSDGEGSLFTELWDWVFSFCEHLLLLFLRQLRVENWGSHFSHLPTTTVNDLTANIFRMSFRMHA